MTKSLFEATVRPVDDPKAALIEGLDIEPATVDALLYMPEYGGLVQKTKDGVRLVVFRAHKPMENTENKEPGLADLVNRNMDEASVHNSIYGTGLYAGNSREAVGLFGYKGREPREIGVYLTSPISDSDIYDARKGIKTTTRIRRLIGRQVLIRVGDSDSLMVGTDSQYGTSQVIIMDKGPDTLVAQNIQVKDNNYPVAPVWYLLRGEDIQLQRIATADPVEPRPYIRRLKRRIRNA